MKLLVTGAAGFIGFHTVGRLVAAGHEVVGLDNLNDYYDVALKEARLAESLRQQPKSGKYRFVRGDVADKSLIDTLFQEERFDVVVHLAAQAGVRYSLQNPYAYIEANVLGFLNILEACRHYPIGHLVYASSSSVYGQNEKVPYAEDDRTDSPVSLYAATKKSNELMAHVYTQLYGIRATGLRFFTVYGPWGRPDMAPYLFLEAILSGRPIQVYNHGKLMRDFTYVDDIVEGIAAVAQSTASSQAVYNIGCGQPVALLDFIGTLERVTGRLAVRELCGMQPGDVHRTFADTTALTRDFGYRPQTGLEAGLEAFYRWYLEYGERCKTSRP